MRAERVAESGQKSLLKRRPGGNEGACHVDILGERRLQIPRPGGGRVLGAV